MLRRCLSTVRTLGGNVTPTAKFPYSNTPAQLSTIPEKIARTPRRVPATHSSTVSGLPGQLTHVNNILPSGLTPYQDGIDATTTQLSSPLVAAPTAIDTLLQFLSQSSTELHGPPLVYDVDTLSSHFTSIVNEHKLCMLPHAHLSSLIGIFGTLSIYPAHCTIYSHPAILNIRISAPQKYWTFVAHLALEKERLGIKLTDSDRYWLMCSDLAIVTSSTEGVSMDSENRYHAMARAHSEYNHIRRHSTDPEVHGPFFEALLSLPTSRHFRMAVKEFCGLVGATDILRQPRMLGILWRIVLQSGYVISHESKDALLSASVKLLQGRTNPRDSVGSFTTCRTAATIDDIGSLAESLTNAAFSLSPIRTDQADSPICQWASTQALDTFGPDVPLAQRWNSLVLLALYHTDPARDIARSGTAMEGKRISYDGDRSDWDAICVLATISKLFSHIGPFNRADRVVKHQAEGVGQILWRSWSKRSADQAPPVLVSRLVAAAFFRLAAITNNGRLTAAANRHWMSSDIWHIRDADELELLSIATLATEYIGASLACRTESLEHIMTELHDSFPGSQWPPLITRIYSKFCQRDIQIACDIYTREHNRVELPTDVNHALAMSLAQDGRTNVVLPFFRDRRASPTQIQELLSAVLLDLAKRQNAILHPDVATAVSDVMCETYRSSPPPRDHRALVQHILPVLVASNYARSAVTIFQALYSSSRSFFSQQFVLRFIPVLLKHGQHSLVTQLMRTFAASKDRVMLSLRKIVLLGLSRGGASSLAVQVNRFTWYGRSRDTMVRAACSVKFRVNHPSKSSSLKISSKTDGYISDGPAVQFAMRLLVRAGRILAATKLFRQTEGRLAPPMRTSLGNAIIDGHVRHVRSRNGRQMRKILAAYKFLVEDCGLVPDRVTVNTLIKAILRWRNAMDSADVRVMFDHLVRHGYPGGDGLAKGQVPFGTLATSPNIFRMPKLEAGMLFERHTRPLLKMFIKAFHVRGDVRSARKIIHILKTEEIAIMKKRDKRRKIRKASKEWGRTTTGGVENRSL